MRCDLSKKNSKIEKIIIDLKSLHRNFDTYSKEKVLRIHPTSYKYI